MGNYIKLKKSNCKNCYKCIRNCPVKSISFSGTQAQIVEDECILCGMCFVACPQNAKEIRDDVQSCKALLKSGAPVYASVAPSFVANYENVNMASMRKALKQLGLNVKLLHYEQSALDEEIKGSGATAMSVIHLEDSKGREVIGRARHESTAVANVRAIFNALNIISKENDV